MVFENKYEKTFKCFELFCKSIFLIIVDFDFLMFFIDPQMYIDFFTGLPLLFNTFFAIFMIYNIILSAKPKVIIKDDILYVYSINKLNVKKKYQINNISNIIVNNDKRNKKYSPNAIVISIFVNDKIINFALGENDYDKFKKNMLISEKIDRNNMGEKHNTGDG